MNSVAKTAFHLGKPEYARRELEKYIAKRKSPSCLALSVTTKPLDR